MGTTQVPAVDMTKLNAFIGQFVTDLGAAFSYWHGGDRGKAGRFYKALAGETLTSSVVTAFDCLHDTRNSIGAAAHVRQSLAKDGTWMIVEPVANHQLKDNLNPVAGCTIPSRRPCGRRVRGRRKADCVLARRLARRGFEMLLPRLGFAAFTGQRRHRSISSTKLDPDLTAMVCD